MKKIQSKMLFYEPERFERIDSRRNEKRNAGSRGIADSPELVRKFSIHALDYNDFNG